MNIISDDLNSESSVYAAGLFLVNCSCVSSKCIGVDNMVEGQPVSVSNSGERNPLLNTAADIE